MGFWDVLDELESENRTFSAKELMKTLDCSYNTVNKHLRKLVKLGYIYAEDTIKYVKNYKVSYHLYKATKFATSLKPKE